MTKINKQQTNQQQSQIPRPLNCFLMYRLEKQKEIVAKCPTANHRDISKIIAKWWQEASEEEKKPFRERARIAKQEHNALYPDYKYAPKKKVTPKRIYIRRNKKQQFTSRAKENNMLMEMIYEDPTALKHLSMNDDTAAAAAAAAPIPNAASEWAPIAAKMESNDICYRASSSSSYSVSPPMSFASCSSPATMPFDSPHVSPYSDYSEFEISSPVDTAACCDTAIYFPSYHHTETISPFSVLDSPCINESNAYGYYPIGMNDYFHSDYSNDMYNKPTHQEFSWSESGDAFVADQNVMQTIYETPVKYINPALLQLM